MITENKFSIAGTEYTHYRIQNRRGLEIGLLDYGATLASVRVPVSGSFLLAILEYPYLSDYLGEHPYIGSTVGRYAGRIKGSFPCKDENGDEEISLIKNDGENHLHGGKQGFSRKIWQATPVEEGGEGVIFHYQSPAGEEGYPGNLATRKTW